MVMDKRVRDIYLIYLGLKKTPESLNDPAEGRFLWYKGNIIEMPGVMQIIKEMKWQVNSSQK